MYNFMYLVLFRTAKEHPSNPELAAICYTVNIMETTFQIQKIVLGKKQKAIYGSWPCRANFTPYDFPKARSRQQLLYGSAGSC